MPIDKEAAKQYLRNFDFESLFIRELGWDRHSSTIEVIVEDTSFMLKAIAHKRGFVAYLCSPAEGAKIPLYPIRRKIDTKVTRTTREHLIIYTDAENTTQIWQWVKREVGKPIACREQTYYKGQTGEPLIQKCEAIAFRIDEEEGITIVDVAGRAFTAFNVERVTKRFYDVFKREHADFLNFIEGIPDEELQRWYASVMLNRLMFIYFIQKAGFINEDTDYLRNKLSEIQSRGKDNFYSKFLCPLFFEGFAKKETERSEEINRLLGRVPYLNGGIFQKHQIEQLHGQTIQMADTAFVKLFAFFDRYQWHLDDRPLRRDDEINPDVLGYIFEKYINQKQMGAYYTKEDITGYISKYTVIPFLFDEAKKKCKIAFEGEQSVWRILQDNPDRYIYNAVKKGVELPLPDEIAAGVDDVSKRKEWNKFAPSDYALPTEIWREVVQRRQRYKEIHSKLENGEVRSINDFITYNLDVQQFAQDVIENCEGPELLRAFYRAIEKITILDPTCGSGAFLFAALNILEPLYEACLDRMQVFLDELERTEEKHHPEKYGDFRKIIHEISRHPNRSYFIYKAIILNNIYGVDIMEEAIEICKLRLFLKLVAQVDSVEKIEPLPDIDFNIRAGNTLVGFTSLVAIRNTMTITTTGQRKMLSAEDEANLKTIEENAEVADLAFKEFHEMQTQHNMDSKEFTKAKTDLRYFLNKLDSELDRYLAVEYGINTSKLGLYQKWRESHKPFHWFVEFYGIMRNGGFDVIIGNPPYVAATKVRKSYVVKNMVTDHCTDIYAWVLERNQNLLHANGRTGMIVPLSLGFSAAFDSCRQLLFTGYSNNWFSSFGRIPSALFSFDVRVRNTIHLAYKSKRSAQAYTTRLHRWFEVARPTLFQTIEYAPFHNTLWKNRIPKLNTIKLAQAFEKALSESSKTLDYVTSPKATKHVLHFKKTAYNWLNFCRELPPCYEGNRRVPHTQFGEIYFPDEQSRDLAMLLANGKLLFTFWCTVADDFHVTGWNYGNFPVDFSQFSATCKEKLLRQVSELEAAMAEATQFKLNAGRRVGNYNLAKCRHVTDKTDALFAKALGISDGWEDVELYCVQVVKTDFKDDEEE